MKKTIFLIPLIGALVLLGVKVLSQPSSGPGGQGSYNVPSTGGSGSGLPGTNTAIAYGGAGNQAGQTNWSAEANGGFYETNTDGSLVSIKQGKVTASQGFVASGGSPGLLISNTLGAGGDYTVIWTNAMFFSTNAELGKWTAYTNGIYIQSNAVMGAYSLWDSTNWITSNQFSFMQYTNGHLFITNYGGSGQSVDIDPSIVGSVLYGDNNRTNYLLVSANNVVISNAVGFTLLSSDSFIHSNRLTGAVVRGTNGSIFASGNIVMTNGGYFSGAITNDTTPLNVTNTTVWGASGLDVTKPAQLIASATNVVIAGFSGINQVGLQRPIWFFTNSAAGLITVTWPAGTRILGGFTTNQPLNTCTVTNGKVALAEGFFYSHLGQTLTNIRWSTQQN